MGFSLTCAICCPVVSNHPVPNVTFWYMDEIIACGHVNRRVQVAIEEEKEIDVARYSVHDIAGTALVSLLLKRFPALQRADPVAVRAPAFYFRQGLATHTEVQNYHSGSFPNDHLWEELLPGSHRIVPEKGMYGEWPDLLWQFVHNQNLDRVSERRDPLLGTSPMSWIPCSVVAVWLGEFWLLSSTSRLKLAENLRAKAKIESWQAAIQSYAKLGANLLVVSMPYHGR